MAPEPDIARPFWLARLEASWAAAPVAWLSGPRRLGKTTIARALSGATYVNCDLPSAQRRLEDPESFFASIPVAAPAASARRTATARNAKPAATRDPASVVILDEVHRLADPSMALKIGADTRPDLRILATGSSTLAATQKFRDSLAGRKREVALQPVLFDELEDFGASIERRLLHGGMPQMLLAREPDPEFFNEWLDSFFARDIAELFRIERRREFLLLFRLLLRQNGGQATVVDLATRCGATRPTVMNWLEALEVTQVIRVIRPYHGGADAELTKLPRIYAFDTGFVAHENGWTELRPEEHGQLWENLVLEHLLSRPTRLEVHYWRDKQRREVDFVVPRGRGVVDAIECKWDARRAASEGFKAFRALHPKGRNFVVAPRVAQSTERTIDGIGVTVCPLGALA
jgi:predicted AAA+ superfamily ATPase